MFTVTTPYQMYSDYYPSKRRAQAKAQKEKAESNASSSHSPAASRDDSSSFKANPDTTVTELLEPAVDGPPSPERLRQLSKQAKRSSHLNRPQGHRSASSGSGSLKSSASDRTDRPAWEQSLDNMSLVRWPTNRSNDSSVPSRPESVQVFGKNLFNMRGRSKRESTANSSSGSSMYSSDMALDNSAGASKDPPFIPTIFNRRKPSRDDSAQKRLQISGPFNFQHVSHTQRDNLADPQGAERFDLVSDMSTMPTPGPISAPSAMSAAEGGIGHHFPNHSMDAAAMLRRDSSITRPSLVPRHTAPAAGGRRLIKHARSQDYLRSSPPRQGPAHRPRSPVDLASSQPAAPVPPPRVSSRLSLRQESCGPLSLASLERPQTSGGFRRPQPFSPLDSAEEPLPPATSHGPQLQSDFQDSPVNENRFSHALTTPGDAAWPLAATSPQMGYETPLPDVPEEEEHAAGVFGRSRLSVTSTKSSLRGSQSAPMLRSLAQAQRPMSGFSETLGDFDTPLVSPGLHGHPDAEERPIRDNWEDDIDYCYDHQADADFDYQWERPSLDADREDTVLVTGVPFAKLELAEAQLISTAHSSPGLHTAFHSDELALDAVNQSSTASGTGATTPTSAPPVTSNFSLPRGDRRSHRPSMLKAHRPMSTASSFQESHGFTLSPSLLIPNDYHQQMLLSEADGDEYAGVETFALPGLQPKLMDGVSQSHNPTLLDHQRSSTSTTETNSTSQSDSTGERHTSANSTWTTLTRLTASSTSLNKMAERSATEGSESTCTSPLADDLVEEDTELDTEQETTPPATKESDTVPELVPFPVSNFGRRAYHKSHSSESIVRDEVTPLKSPNLSKTRRTRARTASLSNQAPPVGQYALFPKTYIKATGDRI